MKQAIVNRIADNEGLMGFLNCYLIMSGYRDIIDSTSTPFSLWWGWIILVLGTFNSIPYFKKLILGR